MVYPKSRIAAAKNKTPGTTAAIRPARLLNIDKAPAAPNSPAVQAHKSSPTVPRPTPIRTNTAAAAARLAPSPISLPTAPEVTTSCRR